ncbi:hypothetical protein [Caballeronia grimmiae]|uniref:hypothetical protein n=1 Tax=Caballeronia grimmiae TaxID=1071679 RepID=UPI0038BBD071
MNSDIRPAIDRENAIAEMVPAQFEQLQNERNLAGIETRCIEQLMTDAIRETVLKRDIVSIDDHGAVIRRGENVSNGAFWK